MTADPRGTDTVAADHPGLGFVPGLELRGDPRADTAIAVPLGDPEAGFEARRLAREAYLRAEVRMGRLRLASYCLTLSACVFALMTFMYLVQGAGDSDATFLSLGVMFGAITGLLLWAAVWVTRVGEGHPQV